MMKDPQKHIVVIGAGVIGLQTAIFLQQACYRVTIIAKHLPGDLSPEYTSPWAGGQWRTHATTDQPTQCRWDLETYKYWQDMVEREAAARAKGEGVPDSGLRTYESLNYWTDQAPLITPHDKHLWFLPHVLSPSTIPATSLPPGRGYGVAYTTFCVNPSIYLRNLQLMFLSSASPASIMRHTLSRDSGLADAIQTVQEDRSLVLGKVNIWVNATGLGSRTLVHDEGVFPTRGQTVLVKGEARRAITWVREKGLISYVIPRPGSEGTILGGCNQPGNWDNKVDEELAQQILDNCKELAPDLLDRDGQFQVVSHQVGFRPSRHGGPRVEFEELKGGLKVVHCYGHAGGGYQNSVGTARQVVRLVGEHCASNTQLANL